MSEVYKDAGVDVCAANELVSHLGIEGFGALIKLGSVWLVLGTDGVGTKILVAEELNKYDTIGIDLVAMCANDVLCHGAKPYVFLDYYATGTLNIEKSKEILKGILEGCEQAGCELVGGETAEMPGVYEGERFDLAGFCMGVVKNKYPKQVSSGDVLVGLPSSGPHSNGFSLIRKLYKKNMRKFDDFLLTPTKIYSDMILPNLENIKALAHITGGGIHGNIPRVIPEGMTYRLNNNVHSDLRNNNSWWIDLLEMSEMSIFEFENVFNCGWGMIAIIAEEHAECIPHSVILGDLVEIVND